ncbi:MAG: SMC-Scp complex subunit ScpB [Myxococcota bacterium]
MTLSVERLRSIIESMLLVSAEPLPPERILALILEVEPGVDPVLVETAQKALVAEPAVERGIRVEEVAGGFQLRTPPENAGFLRLLLEARPQRLTKPALETLAVIAYRQPVTKPEIENIRGVDVAAVLKALLERDLIRIIGKSDELGRPILYGTTKKFLELFGLKSLAALPTLREYHELDEAHQREVDALYEPDRPKISDLAATAEFLVQREHDPDLDALAAAEASAERAEKAAKEVLEKSGAAQSSPEEA